MAKFTDVMRYMGSLNDRYEVPNTRFKLFRLFLKKNHPTLHRLYLVPVLSTGVVLIIWGILLMLGLEIAMNIAIPMFIVFVAVAVNSLVCPFIGVSRLLDSGQIDDLDPEDFE